MTDFHKYGIDDAITDVYKKLNVSKVTDVCGSIHKLTRIEDGLSPDSYIVVNSLPTRRSQTVDSWNVNVNVHIKILSGGAIPSDKLDKAFDVINPIFDDTTDGVSCYDVLFDAIVENYTPDTGYIVYNIRVQVLKT